MKKQLPLIFFQMLMQLFILASCAQPSGSHSPIPQDADESNPRSEVQNCEGVALNFPIGEIAEKSLIGRLADLATAQEGVKFADCLDQKYTLSCRQGRCQIGEK